MNEPKTLTTTYRKFENFLYLMGFYPLRSFKAWDGLTVWEYEDTPEIRRAAVAFKELEKQLRALKEGADHD